MIRIYELAAVVCALCAATLLAPGSAAAEKRDDVTYRYEQVWSASVRMVRVDLRYPVDDQDQDTGFVLFQYQHQGRGYPGSIELMRTQRDGKSYVRVVIKIPQMPSYIEQMLMDRLARKLRTEFGDPPPPRRVVSRREREGDDDDGDGGDDDRGDGGDEGEGDRGASRDD